MKSVLKIYKHDLKAIITNPATLIIIIGLIILPSMYAWFNIAALIDPYGNASNLPIAVYSNDQGTTVDGEEINVGSEVISNLHQNDDLSWQFPDSYQQLEDKVNTGDYYAAVVIPETFSEELKQAIDTYQSPSIDYIVNEKVNAIAPKMTEAGAEGITAEINSNINGIVTKYLVESGNQLNDKVIESTGDYNSAVDSLNQVINNFPQIDQAFTNFDQVTNQVDDGITVIDSFNQQLESDINQIDYTQTYTALNNLRTEVENQEPIDQAIDKVEELEAMTSTFNIDVDTDDYSQLEAQINAFIYNKWPGYKTQIVNVRDKLLEVNNDYSDIAEYLQKDGNQASEFMANPVKLDTETLYPVANYGSASTPFYTTLCLWVGSLLMVSLLNVNSEIKATNRQKYFGKLLLFLTIGILQALIVTAGNVLILDISIAAPFMLMIFDLLIVIVFVTIVFTLVYVFGNVGKALGIILLVLSISGGGGNFPIEVSGPFFNHVYPYLPFTYGVKLLREAGAGIYQPTVYECVFKLITMAIISLSFGLLCANKVKDYFDQFDLKSRENHVIH